MRTRLIIACAIVVFAAGAKAQDALKPCRQIKDDGKRLKCYDHLDRSSSSARAGLGQSRWVITDEKSPLDDSPLVSAALPSSDDRSHLLMRCKDRETQVAVSSTGFINCGPNVRVIYRMNQEQPVETPCFEDPFAPGGSLRMGCRLHLIR
jgi:type VI secretion system protein VasI